MTIDNKEKLYELDTYNYSLPKELIAQYPTKKRDESRLLCYKKDSREISHHVFYEISNLLTNNDLLVLNNTKVIPARFYAQIRDQKSEVRNQNRKIEILLVKPVSPDNLTWKVLAKPKKSLYKAKNLHICHSHKSGNPDKEDFKGQKLDSHFHGNDILEIDLKIVDPETIRFNSIKDLETILNNIGQMPLPPYIKRKGESIDIDRYQTVFAKEPGAVAAPTAALHFTDKLLEKLKSKGVEILYITLHVGPGTFLPVRTNDIREHKLIPESFYIESETWDKITNAKKDKKRIIACGTTTLRALEYAACINKFSGLTNLYITPGFKFNIVDALITNFHLPKTSLLILVSTFIGWKNLKMIYEEAIEKKYRFYSYGDAMFIN